MKKYYLVNCIYYGSCYCMWRERKKREVNQSANESDLDYVKDNGKLIIGYTDYAPMNYTDEQGTFTGFDTELATLVCEKLDLEPEFVEINWDTKEVELSSTSIDCIWNGMTINDDLKESFEITRPCKECTSSYCQGRL